MAQIVMTDLEYDDLADNVLLHVEQSVDRLIETTDVDLDAQRVGGMVTITFPGGSQIVINQQKPLHEIWLAARAGGFHFKHDGGQWQDTKGAGEFFALLTRFASEQAGVALDFSPDN